MRGITLFVYLCCTLYACKMLQNAFDFLSEFHPRPPKIPLGMYPSGNSQIQIGGKQWWSDQSSATCKIEINLMSLPGHMGLLVAILYSLVLVL